MSATFDLTQIDPMPEIVTRSLEANVLETTQFYFFCALCLLFFLARTLFAKDWTALVEAFKSEALAKTRHVQEQFPFSVAWVLLLVFSAGVMASLFIGNYFHDDGSIIRGCAFTSPDDPPDPSPLTLLLFFTGVILALIALRLTVLSLFTFIMPVRKEVFLYIKTVVVFTIFLGIALFPIALIRAFGPNIPSPWFYAIVGAIYAIFVILRVFRGFSIARPFLGIRKDYIIAYFCALEILPVLLILKGVGVI